MSTFCVVNHKKNCIEILFKVNFILFIYRNMNKKILVLWTYLCLLLLVGCGAPKLIDESDEVTVDYVFSFDDGMVYDSGTSTLIVWGEENLFKYMHEQFMGAEFGATITGTLSPEQTYWKNYDSALQQRLAEIYLTAMNITPSFGWSVFFPNLGTGIIINIDIEEGVNYYTIDFNPIETYLPLHYQVIITDVVKK